MVDPSGRLLGVVSIEDVYVASQLGVPVRAGAGRGPDAYDVVALEPDDLLDRALELFVESDLLSLPVVEGPGGRVIGTVKRSDVSKTYLRYVQGSLTEAQQTLSF